MERIVVFSRVGNKLNIALANIVDESYRSSLSLLIFLGHFPMIERRVPEIINFGIPLISADHLGSHPCLCQPARTLEQCLCAATKQMRDCIVLALFP
ncbi:hypothetical protein Bhyg_12359 [Pseudolycoriella hygida]|uniref:Uncharacterized protein n=1 Tax=Pseudolycoriella hygida TaxID=35572 RepID=A0A9Q0MZF1_9DIPT|nr:hypothetical protein Bhyg_12359 [Pseudolycoriella hygida]